LLQRLSFLKIILILKYAYQFAEADKYTVAAPMWNLSIPPIFKAYIDYITVSGITFKYTEQGFKKENFGDKLKQGLSRKYFDSPCFEINKQNLQPLENKGLRVI